MPMVITINGHPIELGDTVVTTLSELLGFLVEKQLGPSELIGGIEVDGKPLDPGYLATEGAKTLDGVGSVNITTIADPVGNAIDLLGQMGSYLAQLAKGLSDVADKFRTGDVEEANAMLVHAIDGLTALTELVSTAKGLAGPEVYKIRYNNYSLAECENNLFTVLKNLKAGQEAKDWVTVADLLEYELAPLVGEWKQILPLLRKKLEGTVT